MRARYRREPLAISAFDVIEIVETTSTGWSDGVLRLDLSDLTARARAMAPALDRLDIRLVQPGDSVRVVNVLDAVRPDVKPADPDRTFPGALGSLAPAGLGATNRLRGLAVLTACDWLSAERIGPEEFPASLVDMGGPGQHMTEWGDQAALVLDCEPNPDASIADVDRSIRKAALRVACDTAATTLGQTPSEQQTFELDREVDPGLPGVAVILQVASEGPMLDTYLYGGAVQQIVPTLLDHREILDGALTCGAYDWPAVRNVTANYQNSALVRSLVAAHGQTLRFAGVVLALGYLDTSFEKERSALISARLCEQLGAEGVICTTFSSGNSHTDTMLTVRACEARGIRSVAIVAETNGGLTDHVPEADAIVTSGNTDELIDPWSPDEVIGGSKSLVGEAAPTWTYLGACVQTGDMVLTAASA
jgi:glycine reductase